MVQTLPRALNPAPLRKRLPLVVGEIGLDDDSPFGLQGFNRDSLQILKPEHINSLALTLALRGSRQQIKDPAFIDQILNRNEDWCDEYRVVHLIEKSLWIAGHSDLVMTLTRNPSQIPDNPPPALTQTLTRAYAIHPQATIWYGVPLFSDQVNEQGLPIPLTASEVRLEAERRITAAQHHALRWGWLYRSVWKLAQTPGLCWRSVCQLCVRVGRAIQRGMNTFHQARKDARRRARAAMRAEMEFCKAGRSWTKIPAHRTTIGKVSATAVELTYLFHELMNPALQTMGISSAPLILAKVIPMLVVPLTTISMDPFLFLELPNEPGKLRHLGHWYWQNLPDGSRKLHLHL